MPTIVYVLIAMVSGVYFFPGKLFVIRSSNYADKRVLPVLSCVVLSTITVLSALLLFSSTSDLLTVFKILALINFFLLSFFYMNGAKRSVVLTHIGFTVLTSVVLAL
jgi:hypothetical protein